MAVAFDHRGVKLRERVLGEVTALGHEPVDLGAETGERRIDYPDKAREIGEAVRSGDAERGVKMHGRDLASYTRRLEAFGWHAIEIDGHDVE